MPRRWVIAAVVVILAVAVAIGWLLRDGTRRADTAPMSADPSDTPPAASVAHIGVTVYHSTTEDDRLVPARVEVPLGASAAEQGRHILNALLEAPEPPQVRVIPEGTILRGFYVSERGDAFADFSRALTAAHSGGSTAELLTVYAVVNTLTANLPTVKRVQILVEGNEVDSLAGHVDVRRPLAADLALATDAAIPPAGPANRKS